VCDVVTVACRSVAARGPNIPQSPAAPAGAETEGMAPMTFHELMGRAHAALASRWQAPADGERGQGTVEYVGLILLVAVLIAGVVQASRSFSDTGIAEAVVKKIKGAIDGVAEAR
jgi:hypothetical protein